MGAILRKKHPLRVTPCRGADLHRTSGVGITAIVVAWTTEMGSDGSGVETNPNAASLGQVRQFLVGIHRSSISGKMSCLLCA